MSYLRRGLITAALTANAIRPVPSYWAGVPAMFAGWLTSELSPQLLTLTALDAARELSRPKPNRAALAVGGVALAGLAGVVATSQRSKHEIEATLREALGPEYRALLEARHTDLDPATALSQLAWPFRMRNPNVQVIKDVVYSPETGRRGLLDIYVPRNVELHNAPVLLEVHGGGWTIGNKDQQGIPLMLHMAERGWISVAINYRLSPRNKFPDHLVDVKRAIAWIREHIGEYGGDPSYIAITGGSAGGHLTALAALTPNDPEYQPGFEDADTRLQAAVPFYGVYDISGATGEKHAIAMRDMFLGPRVFFRDPRSELDHFERASPLLRVRPDAPPFFVMHGVNDTLVSVKQARAFVDALRAVSKEPVAYCELDGTQHAFDVFPSIRSAHVTKGVDRFLRWTYAEQQDR